MTSPRFETLFESDSATLSHARQLAVLQWRKPPSHAAIEQFAPRILGLAQKYPREVRMIALARGLAGVPDDATRAIAGRLLKQLSTDMRAAAFVVLDGGFQAAAQRAVIAGLLVVVRSANPVKVFGTIPDVARWFFPHLPTEQPLFASPDALRVALEQLDAGGAGR